MKKIVKQNTPKFGLCIDWETSGSTWGGDSSIDHQGVSFGAVVFDLATFEPIDTLYREIKFEQSKYTWSIEAQNIHGLSREYLETNGVSQEEAAVDLVDLILKYFGTEKVLMMGHNANFDISFTKQLLKSIDFEFGTIKPIEEVPFINLHHVLIDTACIGLVTMGLFKSDLLFDSLGLTERTLHNALEDALMTVEACKRIRLLVEASLYA